MQTFLPYPDFNKTASVLRMRHLGKQRVEAFQILKSILINDVDWTIFTFINYKKNAKNRHAFHPAAEMWRGYEYTLAVYGKTICEEWLRRGYKDKMTAVFDYIIANFKNDREPWWLGNDEKIHSRHRAMLLGKNYSWYSQFGWSETPYFDGYFWPKKDFTFSEILKKPKKVRIYGNRRLSELV